MSHFAGLKGLAELEVEDYDNDLYISEENRPPYFTQSMAIVVLKAYYKCCGQKRMLEVWTEIKARWRECGPLERETIEGIVKDMMR